MRNKKIIIAPSILNADFSHLADQIKIVEDHGADWLHLDIMDGHFVPNLTFGPPIIEKIHRCTNLPLDTHLMIESPERYLEDFKNAGVDHITVHPETGYHLHRTLQQIKELDLKAGISLNPATPVTIIKPVLDMVDLIMIMTVNPGFGGQKIIESALKKVKEAAALIDGVERDIRLEVDGGVDENTVHKVLEMGANTLVIGSSIYKAEDIAGALKKFRAITSQYER